MQDGGVIASAEPPADLRQGKARPSAKPVHDRVTGEDDALAPPVGHDVGPRDVQGATKAIDDGANLRMASLAVAICRSSASLSR